MAIAINELGTWRRRALIVDDSRLAAAMLRRMLERQGFEVAWAGSPGAALGRLRYDLPDLIFLDHWMEGLCGLDVLSLIKSNPATAGVPVVMFTSMESSRYNEAALASGAFAVLPKRVDGIDMPRLLERLGMQTVSVPVEPGPRRATPAASVTSLPLRVPVKTTIDRGRDTQSARPSLPVMRPRVARSGGKLRDQLQGTAGVWRRAVLGIAAAAGLLILTALLVVLASFADASRATDALATRDQAIAAANGAEAARFAGLLHEAAVAGE